MRNIQKALFLLLLAFVCSCTSDEQLQEFSNVKESNKVTAILSDWNIEDSRTIITTGPYPTAPSPVWVTGDSIGIYPDAGGDQLSFRINEGGSKTCSFDGGGWAMKSSSYTAYSPFKRSFYYEDKDALPISMLGQTQKGNDNADHLGTYDIQIAKGNKPEEGSLVFQFNRFVALARLEITAPKAATWASITLESDALFTTEATMNLALETSTVTSVSTSNSVTLNLENVITTSDNLSIIAYMMLLPVDLTGKTLSVKLTDSESKTYSTNGAITNNKTIFAANAARWVSAIFEAETIPNNQIWYTSSDGEKVEPTVSSSFIASIKSNVYVNGKGIIEFNDDITSIAANAFYDCTNLKSISLSKNISQIGYQAFRGCTNLESCTIPESVQVIDNSLFEECTNLQSIILPNSITTLNYRAFGYCTNLTSITLPQTLETIGDWVFEATGLTSVTLPKNVKTIGANIFYGCENLCSIIVEEGNENYDSRNNCNAIIATSQNELISGCQNTVIPNTVTSIAGNAFSYCVNLVNISIPNSVKSLGIYVFNNCTSLSSITVTGSISTISDGTFSCCNNLKDVTLEKGVETIGKNAFYKCSSIENITIPNTVTTIGDQAFYLCSSLTRVDVKATTPPTISKYTFGNGNNIQFYVPASSIETYKNTDYWKELNLISE